MSSHGAVLLVAQRNADVDDPAAADLYRVGVIARIAQVNKQPNGTARILVEGIAREPARLGLRCRAASREARGNDHAHSHTMKPHDGALLVVRRGHSPGPNAQWC